MRITITGPRSVGKSTIGKFLGKKLKIKYFESDKLMHNKLKKYGGLDKTIKSRKIYLIFKNSIPLIKKVLSEKKFVFDLAGGAISTEKNKELTRKIIKLIKKESLIIGLLPSKNDLESIKFLFKREIKRKHFKETDKKELRKEVKKDFLKVKSKIKKHTNIIIYTKDKTPSQIINVIIKQLKKISWEPAS